MMMPPRTRRERLTSSGVLIPSDAKNKTIELTALSAIVSSPGPRPPYHALTMIAGKNVMYGIPMANNIDERAIRASRLSTKANSAMMYRRDLILVARRFLQWPISNGTALTFNTLARRSRGHQRACASPCAPGSKHGAVLKTVLF